MSLHFRVGYIRLCLWTLRMTKANRMTTATSEIIPDSTVNANPIVCALVMQNTVYCPSPAASSVTHESGVVVFDDIQAQAEPRQHKAE